MERLKRLGLAIHQIGPIVAILLVSPLMGESGVARADKEKSDKAKSSSTKHVTDELRRELIRGAQVWTSTPVAELDLRAGPQGPDAFQPNQLVGCDYVVTKRSGSSPKFECALADGEVLKVKYGAKGEVYAEVLTTRLLWALGFAADPMYPVRVECRGCPPDPWTDPAKVDGVHLFDPASTERKLQGGAIESDKMKGWAWPELDLVDEQQGGASPAQRDALKLFAVFVQHTDNKPEQQRIWCPPGAKTAHGGGCATPIMMLNDVGQTFGRANVFNRDNVGSTSFEAWSKTSVWKDATGCVGRLSRSNTGTLEDPKIGEAGRAFLAGLLVQLSDKQLRDLFEVARVDLRSRKPGSDEGAASVEEWVAAFKHKRDEIVQRRCGA